MNAGSTIRQWILEEIHIANNQGIPVQVEGVYYNNCNIQELPYLQEEESYMKDYLEDERGKIKEIAFDKIKLNNN